MFICRVKFQSFLNQIQASPKVPPNETQEQFARNSGFARVLLGVVKFVAII